MDKLIDMHIHTTFSDGEYAPDETIQKAINNNIGIMAITDHDNIEGIKRVDKTLYPEIEIINGIELSAKVRKGTMHILGYGIDLKNPDLNNKIIELRKNSLRAVKAIVEQIKHDYNIVFSNEDIEELYNKTEYKNIGRPDVAKLCIKYGYTKTSPEAFRKYLGPAHEKTREKSKGIQYEECIDLIRKSGGIPVLAHPVTLDMNYVEFIDTLKHMIEVGLGGLEVYHSLHDEFDTNYYLNVAKEYNLLISGGSDYHGPIVKPGLKLGTGYGNLKIKQLTLVDELHKRAK